MEELRSRIGFSLQTLEMQVFSLLAHQFAEVFVKALQAVDDQLLKLRDSKRYRMKDFEDRSLQTLFGVSIKFKRRRYYDRLEKRSVYLLDEVLNLPDHQQISPALASWSLAQAVMSSSYRAVSNSLKAMYGHSVISHESVRQLVLTTGQELERRKAQQLAHPEGERKVKFLFLEVDGLVASLQRTKPRRRTEEKLLTVHEGWKRRHPSSEEYVLVNKHYFRTQDKDFWEAASRFVYSKYDVDEDTIVVINGDRAPWIRQGVAYFPTALYQVDPFHLSRDLRFIFGKDHHVLSELEEARCSDVTGFTFLTRLSEAVSELKDRSKRREAEALLKDLAAIPQAIVDYRDRLEAQGVATEGLRGMGSAESQVDTFADRVKRRGRSWSREGLGAIMELLCWRNTGSLPQLMDQVEELLARTGVSLEEVKQHAVRQVRELVRKGVDVPTGSVPVTRRGRTGSGGLSWWMNRVISGTTG